MVCENSEFVRVSGFCRFIPVVLAAFLSLGGVSPPIDEAKPNRNTYPHSVMRDARAQRRVAPYHPERVIVRFKRDATTSLQHAAHQKAGCRRVLRSYTSISNLVVVEAPAGHVTNAIAMYQEEPGVLFAEPDYSVEAVEIPNDSLFDRHWGLENTGAVINGDPGIADVDISAADTWTLWTGDPTFRVAVIDSGIDLSHPDIASNIWTNPHETPDDGIDNDGNGWVDDVHGFDTSFGNLRDDLGHGTHIAGIIAAVGNNGIGVTGVNWRASIVTLKFIGSDGTGYISDAITALEYVIDTGIRVSNNSWGCYGCYSQALYDAIAVAGSRGHLFVAASGNGIFGLGVDTDRYPHYPSAFDLPNIVSVAAIDNDGRKAKFSNYGATTVDFAAPGVEIISTMPGDRYLYRSGTSMAAAYATGAAALALSRRPELTVSSVIARLRATAKRLPELSDRMLTPGIVNAAAADGDCNGNGVSDEIDIGNGSSGDCDSNLVPDECERDCNANGVPDSCDLLAGAADCNANQVPDQCEADCNANAQADACDIAQGSSSDCNWNSVPDECEPDQEIDCQVEPFVVPPGFALLPVGASAAHAIQGNSIVLYEPNQRVELEFRVSGWDPDADGIPRLKVYQASVDPNGFSSGAFGKLAPSKKIPCVHNDQCLADARCNLAEGFCEPEGSLGIDEARPDFVFYDEETISASSVNRLLLGSLVFESERSQIDPQTNLYAGTLLLDVPEHASGQFVVGPQSGTAVFMLDAAGNEIYTNGRTPTIITLRYDCNDNGVPDAEDLLTGTSRDCNHNTTPDECETHSDCNANGIQDICDIGSADSLDCNNNDIPDECENDCNENGMPDECDIRNDISKDQNSDLIPDESEESQTIYVDLNACPASGNGSKDTPFCRIQDAIDSAVDGDEVVVAEGTYQGSGNRDLSFGGRLITLRSAQGPAKCIIDPQGHGRGLIFDHEEDESAQVIGLSVVNGYAGSTAKGGGIYVKRSRPTIKNCRVLSSIDSHGIYCDVFGDATIHATEIAGNDGWGIRAITSNPVVTSCVIRNNGEGGIRLYNSDALISNCSIIENRARYQGGGVECYCCSSPIIVNTIVWANTAPRGPQLSAAIDSAPIVRYCIIEGGSQYVYLSEDSRISWGAGNVDEDPLIEAGAVGVTITGKALASLNLSADSPGINAGDPSTELSKGDVDLGGSPRLMGCRVDIGAFESAVGQARFDFNDSQTIDLNDISWFVTLQPFAMRIFSRRR
jgi:parallel beta-helix repeat protein